MPIFQILLIVFSLFLAPGARAGSGVHIVTDIAPIRALVSAVAGPDARVEQIVPDGVSPHEFTLKPSQMRALQRADLIVWLGPVATPGLAKLMGNPAFLARAITLNQLKLTKLLSLRQAGLLTRPTATNVGMSQEVYDPHSWLDPRNAVAWVDEVARVLSASMPASAQYFKRNADAEITRIEAAEVAIKTRLHTAARRPFMQFHDAFQYFEYRFDLAPMGLATTGDSETTSLRTATTLRAALAQSNGACVFTASQAQVARAGVLLDVDGVTHGTLDALGRSIAPDRFDYPALLVSVADGFMACLAP